MSWGTGGSIRSCDALLKRVEGDDPTLTELVILPMKVFGPLDADRLSRAIASGANTHLKSISASGHNLPPESLKQLARALSIQAMRMSMKRDNGEICGISSIAIGSNDMRDSGVIALCEGLEESNGGLLRMIDFGWKNIGNDGVRAIGKTFASSKYLTQIDLSRNSDIGNEEIACLVKAAKERAGDETVAFPSLEKLILSECNIGPKGMKNLAEMLLGTDANRCKLIYVAISSNPIGPEGCEALARLIAMPEKGSMLSCLYMSQCSIGDEGVKLLSNAATSNSCCGLTHLDLSENSITSDGARVFAASLSGSWPSLVELKLAKNDLGSEGVTSVMESLRSRSVGATDDAEKTKNQSLKNVDLTCTGCEKEGAIAALNSSCLTTLRLFNNRLGSEGFRSLSALLRGGHPSIENLDLGGNDADEESVIVLLNAIADKVDDGAASKLSVLEIGGNKFGAKAMDALTKLKQEWPRLDVAHDKPIEESDED